MKTSKDDLRVAQSKWLVASTSADDQRYLTISSVYGTMLTKALDYMPVLRMRNWDGK